jgi:recombination protein RecR
MALVPPALEKLIEALGSLPGVGPRTAERYAYYLIRHDPSTASVLASALTGLHSGVKYCPVTFALISADEDVSPLYDDPRRDKSLIAVVAEPFDVVALEKTGQFTGTYHVLGGLVSPIDGIGPESLHIAELIERVKKDKVTEIVLATNASVEGESTALYIQQQVEGLGVTLSRLARGLPIGVDLEYADQITLGRALEARQAL